MAKKRKRHPAYFFNRQNKASLTRQTLDSMTSRLTPNMASSSVEAPQSKQNISPELFSIKYGTIYLMPRDNYHQGHL